MAHLFFLMNYTVRLEMRRGLYTAVDTETRARARTVCSKLSSSLRSLSVDTRVNIVSNYDMSYVSLTSVRTVDICLC